jgi:hypothetical protein
LPGGVSGDVTQPHPNNIFYDRLLRDFDPKFPGEKLRAVDSERDFAEVRKSIPNRTFTTDLDENDTTDRKFDLLVKIAPRQK